MAAAVAENGNEENVLKFIIIGLICTLNNGECYWAQIDNYPKLSIYEDYPHCKIDADKLRKNSIMYFKTDCMVYIKETN